MKVYRLVEGVIDTCIIYYGLTLVLTGYYER